MFISKSEDLTNLKNNILEINKDIVVQYRSQRGFLDGLFVSEKTLETEARKACEDNNELYKKLPATIEINSELARDIIQYLDEHASTQKQIDDKHKPYRKFFGAVIAGTGLVLTPTPHHAVKAAKKTVRAFQALDKHTEETRAFEAKQDTSIIVVLGAYHLEEVESGKYTLSRGSWEYSRETESDGRSLGILHMIRPTNTTLDCVPKNGLFGSYNYTAFNACGYKNVPGLSNANISR